MTKIGGTSGGSGKSGGSTGGGKVGGSSKGSGSASGKANDAAMQSKIAKHAGNKTPEKSKGETSGKQSDIKKVGTETPVADHLLKRKEAEQANHTRATTDQQALDVVTKYSQREQQKDKDHVQGTEMASAAQAPQWGLPTGPGQDIPKTGTPQIQPGPSISEPGQPLNGANDNKPKMTETGPRNWIDRISDSVVSRGLTALGATGLLAGGFLVGMTKPLGAKTSTSHEFASGGRLEFSSSASRVDTSYTGKDQSTYKVGTKFDHDSKAHLFSSAELKQADGSFKTLERKDWPQDLKDHKGVIYQNGKIDPVPTQGADKPETAKSPYKPEQGISYTPAESDLVASLKAQGKSNAEIQREIENVGGGGSLTGTRTHVSQKHDEATIRSLQRENESADILAKNGYNVEQNPAVAGGKNPDYKINGEIYDNYAPSTGNVSSIWSAVNKKIQDGQTNRVVINLKDSSVNLENLRAQFQNYPIQNLDDVIIIDSNGKIRGLK